MSHRPVMFVPVREKPRYVALGVCAHAPSGRSQQMSQRILRRAKAAGAEDAFIGGGGYVFLIPAATFFLRQPDLGA